MDRKIDRKRPVWLKPLAMAAAPVLAGIVAAIMLAPSTGRVLRVDGDRLVISKVVRGKFEDFIPVRGRVTPLRTVYLDAVEGGRVEEVLVEDGAAVDAGTVLLRLSNTALQLEVIAREAQVTEQINNLHTLELSLEQNRLSHKRNLAEIEYQITDLTRKVKRRRILNSRGHLSQSDLDAVQDELAYQKKLKKITLEAQQADETIQEAQLIEIRKAVGQLERNLALTRRNLDALNIRAPISGQLTAFDAEVGQSLGPGQRVGQIDDPRNFKLLSRIDEFYLGRIDIGQSAAVKVGDRTFTLIVKKVYPTVHNGQFEVDLEFNGRAPEGIRRGQTLQARLSLGDTTEAVLIPYGAFYQDTAGNWVFVVTSDGKQAVRRSVRLGRRNTEFIEVLEGLEPGERVITSPYTNFVNMQRLEIR